MVFLLDSSLALYVGIFQKKANNLRKELADSAVSEKGDDMNKIIVIGKDGNQVTAHFRDFINLQLSDCGFGDTERDAVLDLKKQTDSAVSKEHKPPRKVLEP